MKVAVSTPDAFIEIFKLFNASGSVVVLESTQPLTEMSTRNLPLGVNAAGA